MYVPNGREIYKHFPVQLLPKYTMIGIYGMQMYHLETLGLA
jgi:hypothetical protein